jgi:glucose-1-phosphate cytidylyltransferase
MKVLILAGGYGTRLSEETGVRPKPLVEIGERPILWHIMKHYSHYGFNDFVVLCGYKGHSIKDYFANYYFRESSVTFNLSDNSMETIHSNAEPWRVTCMDTGDGTMTGGRILRARDIVGDDPFMLTYGDGVADVDLLSLVESHKKSKRMLTMTAVQPSNRYGVLEFDSENQLKAFKEKPQGESGWINGGFFVCENKVFDYIDEGDKTIFERTPLETLAQNQEVNCYRHSGFWKCMDTLADKKNLTHLWEKGEAKWKVW